MIFFFFSVFLYPSRRSFSLDNRFLSFCQKSLYSAIHSQFFFWFFSLSVSLFHVVATCQLSTCLISSKLVVM